MTCPWLMAQADSYLPSADLGTQTHYVAFCKRGSYFRSRREDISVIRLLEIRLVAPELLSIRTCVHGYCSGLRASSGCRFILGNLTLIKCSCILALLPVVESLINALVFLALLPVVESSIKSPDTTLFSCHVRQRTGPLALRRYSFVANILVLRAGVEPATYG
ncbi:hypothetical protein T09_9902 [Trichinella sp. T9]|nr:hypothetical protein T09_9902 [Trichinella sp. T9]